MSEGPKKPEEVVWSGDSDRQIRADYAADEPAGTPPTVAESGDEGQQDAAAVEQASRAPMETADPPELAEASVPSPQPPSDPTPAPAN